jgi:hypothetical protein
VIFFKNLGLVNSKRISLAMPRTLKSKKKRAGAALSDSEESDASESE